MSGAERSVRNDATVFSLSLCILHIYDSQVVVIINGELDGALIYTNYVCA